MKINKYRLIGNTLKHMLPICTFFPKKWKNYRSTPEEELPISLDALQEETIDLSLIVPVYNSEKYLPRCLESLQKQKTKYYYEVVLVDDGSTDHSLEYLKKLASESQIFVVVSQDNQGISGARNTGLLHARGKYVGFIDNDDFVSPDYCEVLLDHAYRKSADIVKCGHIRFDLLTEKIVSVITQESASISGEIGNDIIKYKGFVWGGVYRKQLFDNIRFPVGFWYEDMIGRLLLLRKCRKFVFEEKPLYFYSLHKNNASKKVWKKDNDKALDQLKLAKMLAIYGEQIGLERDNGLYRALLVELGPVLWMRIRKMNHKVVRSAFYDAKNFITKYTTKISDMTDCEKYIERSFKEDNFHLWKWASLAYMCNVKAENG